MNIWWHLWGFKGISPKYFYLYEMIYFCIAVIYSYRYEKWNRSICVCVFISKLKFGGKACLRAFIVLLSQSEPISAPVSLPPSQKLQDMVASFSFKLFALPISMFHSTILKIQIIAFADTFVLEEMKFYFFLFVLTMSASLTHSSYLWKPVSLNRIELKVPQVLKKYEICPEGRTKKNWYFDLNVLHARSFGQN